MNRSYQLFLSLFFAALIAPCQLAAWNSYQPQYDNEPVKVGLLPDTQGIGKMVSIYPMEAVLQKLQEQGVDIVIPVGDLTNQGSSLEFDQWASTAEKYRDA